MGVRRPLRRPSAQTHESHRACGLPTQIMQVPGSRRFTSPPRPPSPLRPQTPAGDGRRGENGSTSTVPDAGMAKRGPSVFMHDVSFQPAAVRWLTSVGRAFDSDHAGYWQTPTHVASPPQPPSPLLRQTAGGDGRRGENGSTSTVPDAGMAKCGPRVFMHNLSFQPDSASRRAGSPSGRCAAPGRISAPCSSARGEPSLYACTGIHRCGRRAGDAVRMSFWSACVTSPGGASSSLCRFGEGSPSTPGDSSSCSLRERTLSE